MTERESFLRAVCADPDDDTVRLAMADWLGEQPQRGPCPLCKGEGVHRSGYVKCDVHGIHDTRSEAECANCSGTGEVADTSDAGRAEFIRVQVELAKRDTDGHAGGNTGCRTCELLDRERELIAADDWRNAAVWFCPDGFQLVNIWGGPPGRRYPTLALRPGEPDGTDHECIHCSLSRGFVSAITCTGEDWVRHGDAILREHPVRKVTLTTHLEIPHFEWRHSAPHATKRPHTTFAGVEIEMPPRSWPPGRTPEWYKDCYAVRWPGVEFELSWSGVHPDCGTAPLVLPEPPVGLPGYLGDFGSA